MKLELPAKPVLLPSPVLVIGTYGSDGKANIMTAAWGGIASSNPPCVSVSIREARLTHQNIMQNGAFTVNIPSEKHMKEADFAGIVSGKKHDKFIEARLTPEKSKRINAPIVKEFPYALECKLIKQIELGVHTMFIGEIVGIVAESEVLDSSHLPDIEKVRPMLFSTSNSAYYSIGDKVGTAYSAGKELKQEEKK